MLNYDLFRLASGCENDIDYDELIKFLNYRKNPATPIEPINIPVSYNCPVYIFWGIKKYIDKSSIVFITVKHVMDKFEQE